MTLAEDQTLSLEEKNNVHFQDSQPLETTLRTISSVHAIDYELQFVPYSHELAKKS